jgi:predicted nucleic acid-binding protein
MNTEVTIPIVIDTNVLVPAIFSNTHILYFILEGNLLVIWNKQTLGEALKLIDRIWIKHYRSRDPVHDIDTRPL